MNVKSYVYIAEHNSFLNFENSSISERNSGETSSSDNTENKDVMDFNIINNNSDDDDSGVLTTYNESVIPLSKRPCTPSIEVENDEEFIVAFINKYYRQSIDHSTDGFNFDTVKYNGANYFSLTSSDGLKSPLNDTNYSPLIENDEELLKDINKNFNLLTINDDRNLLIINDLLTIENDSDSRTNEYYFENEQLNVSLASTC